MNTALIILCIVLCIAVVLYIVSHFGVAIRLDKKFRDGLTRRNARRRTHGEQPQL